MNHVASARPRSVAIAVALLCAALIYSLGWWTPPIAQATLVPPISNGAGYAGTAFGVCSSALVIYNIFKGHNWARIAYLVIFLLGILISVPGMLMLIRQPNVWGEFDMIVDTIQFVALVLLFAGSGSSWFKNVAV